jgi:hypothetical protein
MIDACYYIRHTCNAKNYGANLKHISETTNLLLFFIEK